MSDTHPLLKGKSSEALALYAAFLDAFKQEGATGEEPLKSMIAINGRGGHAAYVTQVGKNFIHAVFPFPRAFPDNLCFQKIAPVPGQQQVNHHFRMLSADDLNEEVRSFMRRALEPGE
ncbi:hypothetical protein [Chitinophaga caseinilytica]|uniref:hypothetical protein n=1 Tax=Chitinophaga caseinilytica TaxID=2267521 RepID=UPI003C2FDB5F